MKAVVCNRYGPPEVLQLKEVPKPVPKANEILIKIVATTVTVADFRIRSFTVPLSFWIPARFILGLRRPKKSILGGELSGVVEAVGTNVKLFRKGDAVLALSFKDFGAYAQYKCLHEKGNIVLKPAHLSFEQAAALPVGALTALHYLQKAQVTRGQKVLIYGASGSVGSYAVQLAKYYFDAEVTAICSGPNIPLVIDLGADKAIDYTETDFTQKLEQYDVVFIAIDKFPFSECNKYLKSQGTYINITAPFKSLSMHWVQLTSTKKFIMGEHSENLATNLKLLMDIVSMGLLQPVIDRTYTLEEIVEAHRHVERGHKKGNVVVRVD